MVLKAKEELLMPNGSLEFTNPFSQEVRPGVEVEDICVSMLVVQGASGANICQV